VIIILNLNQKVVEDILLDLERLKSHLLNVYQKEKVLEYTSMINNPEYKQPLRINGYSVFQFAYAGSIPLNRLDDEELRNLTKSYMEWCTHSIYNPKEHGLPFKRAKIFIQHFYKNKVIRDLDNRNHKFILDAIRLARIIKDDNWQNISLDISGHLDERNHVQVYVVDEKNKHHFAKYLDDHKYKLQKTPFPHEMFMKKRTELNQNAAKEVEVSNFW